LEQIKPARTFRGEARRHIGVFRLTGTARGGRKGNATRGFNCQVVEDLLYIAKRIGPTKVTIRKETEE